MSRSFWPLVGALAVCCLVVVTTVLPAQTGEYAGPTALVASKDEKTLWVAGTDAQRIARVDVATGKVIQQIAVPAEPTGLVLSPDGKTLYVTCAAPRSTVCVIETTSGRLTASIPAGHTAMAPAIGPDGKRLYVCNRFDDDLSVIDLNTGKQLARVPVGRQPIAAAVTPDGKSVVVANHLPADPANQFFVSAVVTVVDTRTHRTAAIRLPNGAGSLRGLCLAPNGRLAYVTHVLSNYELVPSQVAQGWTNINALSIIDVAQKRLVNTVSLDDSYLGAANPWAVACSADGKWLGVTHAGTHELSLIDVGALLTKLGLPADLATPAPQPDRDGGAYASATVNGIPSSMGIMTGLRRRVRLPGLGPRGLALVGSKVYVAGYFSDTIDVVDLKPDTGGHVESIPLGPKPHPTRRRRGEMLFHDAVICYQHWQSCSSCHPDARADVLNWDLRNDGVGNPKNTKSMLLAHKTPPAMATGVRPSAEVAVRNGIKHTLFADRPEADAMAIDEYLNSLEPVPSPHLLDGRLSPAAVRGKRLFQSDRAGCHRCHPAPLYTDQLMHDVDTQGPYDVAGRFDTPTLVEVWRTAPYLHDGRYTSVEQLLSKGKHGLRDGRFEKLDRQQLNDLIEFVLSL